MSSGLRTRILTSLVLAPAVGLAILYLPSWGFAILVSVMMLAAFWEWSRLSGVPGRPLRAVLTTLLGLGFYGLWLQPYPQLLWPALLALVFWGLALFWLIAPQFGARDTLANRFLKTAAGVILLAGAWAGAVYIRDGLPGGPIWLLVCLAVIYGGDSLAYFVGSRIGGRKLAPRISPGKTWAGLYGAVFGVAPLALALGWLKNLSGQTLALWMLLAMGCLLLSVLGDLVESIMKRHRQVKDSGRLFPGHGGVLDRGDSLFAALPAFALGLAWLLS